MPPLRYPRRKWLPGAIVSLCLHLALLGGLAVLPSIEGLNQQPEEEGIEVELVTLEQIAPKPEMQAAQLPPSEPNIAPPRDAPPQPQTPAQPNPPAVPPVPAAPIIVRARRLLADEVLANPRSRGTRQALAQLDEAERIEQICNIEAMGQVHAWKAEFEPDRVVAYAMAGTRLSPGVLRADGAAFRSRQNWYRLKFRCELTSDRKKIAGFEFEVGEAVPRSEWQARDLPAVH